VLGCDALQGNLIARPQSADDIVEMLGSRVAR